MAGMRRGPIARARASPCCSANRRRDLLDRPAAERGHFQTLLTLAPYLWPKGEPGLRARVVIAIGLLVVAKAANVLVPIAYARAIDIVARDRKASTSYLQRKLSLGYNRAAKLIERMEMDGVISRANHAGRREILVPPPNDD